MSSTMNDNDMKKMTEYMARFWKSITGLFKRSGKKQDIKLTENELDDFYQRTQLIIKEQEKLMDAIDKEKEPLKHLALEVRKKTLEHLSNEVGPENRDILMHSPIEVSENSFKENTEGFIKTELEALLSGEDAQKIKADPKAILEEVQNLNNLDNEIISKYLDPSKRYHMDLIKSLNATTGVCAREAQKVFSPAAQQGEEVKVYGNENNKQGHDKDRSVERENNRNPKGFEMPGV